ncbi:MAG: VOC family protein [Candidatus Nanopelagicales bacterium]
MDLTPFYWFDEGAHVAAAFYADLFDDAEVLDGAPGPDSGPPLTVSVRIGNQRLTFLNGGPHFELTPAASLMVACADQAEIDRYWDALTDGGEEMQCGWLTDRFGMTWQIVPSNLNDLLSDPDPDRAARAMAAMLSMVKFDIEELEQAAAG